MVLSMWQDDMIRMVRFINECIKKSCTHLISIEMAGNDVMSLSLSLSISGREKFVTGIIP